MNKIAVFGASGQTGLCVLKAALTKGIEVKALLRDPSRLPKEFDGKINIVQGDVLKLEDVKKTIEGQDAVVVALGPGPSTIFKFWTPEITVMSEGMKNVVAAMKELNISVVSVCLSAFLFLKPDEVWFMFRKVNADHQRMYDVVKESGLKWVAVFAPRIKNQPATGYVTKHGENAGPKVVSTNDLGQFLVDSISMPEHYQKVVGISSNS